MLAMSRTIRNHGPDAEWWMREKKNRDKKPVWKPNKIDKQIAHQIFRAQERDALNKDKILPDKHRHDLIWNVL